jgi:hypothetical protein
VRVTEPIDEFIIHQDLPRPNARPPHAELERQGGRRNFLTWAFFLAQVSALELLLTGATKAQADEISGNSINRSEAPSDPLPDDVPQRKFDIAEAQVAAPPSSSTVGSQVTPHLDSLAQTHPLPPASAAEHTLPIGTVGGSAANSLPTLLPEIGSAEQTASPAIDVNIGLSPLLGFELHIDAGGLISGVGLDLGNLLVNPLESATDLVGSLVTDLGHLLNNDLLGLGQLLDSSPLNLSELTGLTLTNGIAGLLGGSEAGAPSALLSDGGAILAPLISLTTHDGALSAPGLLSGGMINFPAVSTPAQIDVLYAQGQHTDYNIALHNHAQTGAEDASPLQTDIAGILPETLAHEVQPPADSATALLSPLDEFLTRPGL